MILPCASLQWPQGYVRFASVSVSISPINSQRIMCIEHGSVIPT
jgi:hypothetical protein